MKNNIDSSDPFEEFEFKPLTEGLGFHRNDSHRNTITTSTASSRPTHSTLSSSMSSPQNSVQKNSLKKVDYRNSNLKFELETDSQPIPTPAGVLNSPLPRNVFQTENIEKKSSQNNFIRPQIQVPTIEDDSIAHAQTAVNDLLKTLNHKKQTEEMHLKSKKKLIWKNTTPSVLAGFLDSMLVIATFLIMMISMLTITKIDLIANLTNPGFNSMIWVTTLLFFSSTALIYMVVFRTYLGYSPGEWAFDYRCGTDIQHISSTYILKITLRSLIVIGTGFLPLTLISMLFNIDITSLITGINIQKQTHV